MAKRSLPAWALLALWLGASAPAAAQDSETFEYRVRSGDTCALIARRFYGDWRRYDVIMELNPILREGGEYGHCGPALRPGVTLTLRRDPGAPPPRRAASSPDAELTAVRRRVQAREPEAADWQRASRGLDLFRGWRVNTLDEATAEVTFRDTSIVHMRENTLVIIFGGEASTARRRTTTARLERGALRSRLGRLRLEVETPSASAALEGGDAVVSVDGEGTSRVSNHQGGPASVRGQVGDAVAVRPGYGSEVRAG
ncbi:MAG: LysM domain-containing protein, partial [Myxococcota bacterium]